jgi:hypothetical protein
MFNVVPSSLETIFGLSSGNWKSPTGQNVAVDIPLTVCHKVEYLSDMWMATNGKYTDLA